jgi:hypothetical protein
VITAPFGVTHNSFDGVPETPEPVLIVLTAVCRVVTELDDKFEYKVEKIVLGAEGADDTEKFRVTSGVLFSEKRLLKKL